MSAEAPSRSAAPRWRQALAASQPYRLPALALLVLAGLALWQGPRLLLGPEVPVSPVLQRDFVQSVVASGHVETPHRVSIAAQIVGTVRRVPVAEGQQVVAGQLLLELESSEARAALAQAELAVRQAEARLRQLREVQAPVAQTGVRQAQAGLDNARAQWGRAQQLFQQGFIGQAALDEARKTLELSEAQLRAAQTQLATAQPQGSDSALAAAALAQAQASVDAARARLGYTSLRAPVAGQLISRDVEPGDVVQAGKTLMQLSPAGPTELVVQIDEKNLQLLALGQPAQASADAYPEQRFAARLSYINPGVDLQRGSVEVKLSVPEPPATLRQDMTVSVDIQVARRPQALLLPLDAVREAEGAKPWALKVEGRHAQRQALQLGLRSGGWVEVLQGLQAGDLVVPPSASAVREGSRLRPVSAKP